MEDVGGFNREVKTVLFESELKSQGYAKPEMELQSKLSQDSATH